MRALWHAQADGWVGREGGQAGRKPGSQGGRAGRQGARAAGRGGRKVGRQAWGRAGREGGPQAGGRAGESERAVGQSGGYTGPGRLVDQRAGRRAGRSGRQESRATGSWAAGQAGWARQTGELEFCDYFVMSEINPAGASQLSRFVLVVWEIWPCTNDSDEWSWGELQLYCLDR